MIRRSIFTIAILCLTILPVQNPAQQRFRYDVKLGVDVIIESGFSLLSGKKVGLVTNQSGRTRLMQTSVEAFLASDSCTLTAIFTPEHGYYGTARAGELVTDSTAKIKGVPVYSLYGATRRPTKEMLETCDVIVFDIQDIGLRSYTFLSTMYNVMDACAEFEKELVVLDRPNPLGGAIVDGSTLDTAMRSFVGIIPTPYVHGCTFGELAIMINEQGWLPPANDTLARKCSLKVVPMQNWGRWMTWEDTDIPWTPTSPHIPSVNAIRGAAMTGIYGELSLASIGIGYTLPFQMLGTPNLNMEIYSLLLQRLTLHGIIVSPTEFRPFYGKYARRDCKGIRFSYYPDIKFRPYTSGLELILALRRTHPEMFVDTLVSERSQSMFGKVTGSDVFFDLLYKGGSDDEIRYIANTGRDEFIRFRSSYLLYE